MGGADASAGMEAAAMARRQALAGKTGPAGLMQNLKVFSIALFACIGGLLYGYNQGVFSGICEPYHLPANWVALKVYADMQRVFVQWP